MNFLALIDLIILILAIIILIYEIKNTCSPFRNWWIAIWSLIVLAYFISFTVNCYVCNQCGKSKCTCSEKSNAVNENKHLNAHSENYIQF